MLITYFTTILLAPCQPPAKRGAMGDHMPEHFLLGLIRRLRRYSVPIKVATLYLYSSTIIAARNRI